MGKTLIILSPSQQIANKCVMCDSEKNHCRIIAKKMYDKLNQDPRLIVELIPDYSSMKYPDYLNEAVAYSNDIVKKHGCKTNIHFSIHTDAFDGHSIGSSAFYYPDNSVGKKIATEAIKLITDISGIKRALEDRKDLYEIRGPKATSVLIELNFHDNMTGAKNIHDNYAKYADACCLSIYSGLDIRTENKKDWQDILKECTQLPDKWEKAILSIINKSDLGDMEMLKFLPDLIEKCYYRSKT